MSDTILALSEDLDSAFQSVVVDMGPRLYWGLRRMSGDHQEAEDLTQEAFINAYKAMQGFGPADFASLKLEPWLWTIALNVGRNHLRTRSRRPTFVAPIDSRFEDPAVPDERAWDVRFSVLNEHQRTAVVLRHVVGLGIDEIADATGRAPGTIKADIHRGLTRLRKRLEQENGH